MAKTLERFQAKVAEKVKAGETVEAAQRAVAAEEPELYSAIRSEHYSAQREYSRADSERSRVRAGASAALASLAREIAQRDGVELDEALRCAAREHPHLSFMRAFGVAPATDGGAR